MRSLVLLGAGSGSRLGLGYNKIFYKFQNDKTILQTTIELFYNNPLFDDIILVYNEADKNKIKQQLKSYPNIKIVKGIGDRAQSVHAGILACKNDIVYIHDTARCNFDNTLIKDIEKAVNLNYDCITLGVKCIDTISQVENNLVKKNLKREELVCIQTPQIINKNIYLQIYDQDKSYTDEGSLFFQNNKDVLVIDGSYENIKITTMEDLRYYEYIKFIRQ